MDPITTDVQILGKNKQQELILKYILSSVPTNKWALFFNSKPTPFSVKVVIGSEEAYVIVTGLESKLMTSDIIGFLNTYIEVINTEELSSEIKEQILLANYTPGMVMVHNSLFDVDDTTAYENYITMVSDRIYI